MAKSSTVPTSTSSKKSRVRRAHAYVAKLSGEEAPVIILAATQKAALAAIITLSAATQADLIKAGAEGYRIIDTTTPPTTEAATE